MQLNLAFDQLPGHCDVLVIGAGPAGSAAARTLAQAGFDVVLVDQQAFPRDKVCGDGLIPDAHNALRKLGLLEAVHAQAQSATAIRCIGPRGQGVDIPGTLSVIPRKQLDLIVCQAAVDAGARMVAPARFVAPIEELREGVATVVGATLQQGDAQREVRAPWVLLATGAVPQGLQAAGLCERRTPSAIALRGYVRNRAMDARITQLEVLWHPAIRSGYGWIFPCGDGLFNVGVGVMHSHAQDAKQAKGRDMSAVNLREMLRTFERIHPPAQELIAGGVWEVEPKGAPLRCSLDGATYSRPGLIATGEAVGTTYALTGEGIGKALETGILAAEAVIEGRTAALGEAEVRGAYEARVRALRPRYDVYSRANAVNSHPWLIDLLVWSARRSPSRLQRISAVLEETYLPRDPLTVSGLMRLAFQRR